MFEKLERELVEALHLAVDTAFESEQVEWLAEVVNAPSHTWAPDDVEAAASIVDRAAEECGFSRVEKVDPEHEDLARHRIYSTPATGNGRALALVGHVDTVFPRSTGFLEFSRDGDVARGPGVLDMKSGLSVALFAQKALRSVDSELADSLPLRFVCVSDEEVGSPSSCHLYGRLSPLTTAALVFEAGRVGDLIVTQRKGGGTFKLRVHGRAAHAGNGHAQGINAIHALALVIPRIEALTDYDRGLTVNTGIVSGGTAKNTIPEHAECVIDCRFLTREDADWVVAEIEAIAADPFAGLDVRPERLRDATFELDGRIGRYPMEATEASQRLRKQYESHAQTVGFAVGEAPLQGGGSDANILAADGVPCIDGLGPFGKGFHSLSEWCNLDSLRRRTQALATFLADEALRLRDA